MLMFPIVKCINCAFYEIYWGFNCYEYNVTVSLLKISNKGVVFLCIKWRASEVDG